MGAHMRTVGSRRLVIELKRFREAAGLTGEQVAEQMGWSAAKVYRIEGDRSGSWPATCSGCSRCTASAASSATR